MMGSMLQDFFKRFGMTKEERLLVMGIVAIALIGTVARYWHLRHKAAQPYAPPGLEQYER